MKKIEKFVHKCRYNVGDTELEHKEEVEAWEVEYDTVCLFCGEVKATADDLAIHVYEQLTKN